MVKLLINSTWEMEDKQEAQKFAARARLNLIGMIGLAVLAVVWLLTGCSYAKEVINEPNIAGYSLNQWCNAIYIAEGGSKAKYPYGILIKYKHTTPLQACRNTILHYWHDYSKLQGKTGISKRFLDYARNRYCPINSDTDNGTCKYWSFNVEKLLKRGSE